MPKDESKLILIELEATNDMTEVAIILRSDTPMEEDDIIAALTHWITGDTEGLSEEPKDPSDTTH